MKEKYKKTTKLYWELYMREHKHAQEAEALAAEQVMINNHLTAELVLLRMDYDAMAEAMRRATETPDEAEYAANFEAAQDMPGIGLVECLPDVSPMTEEDVRSAQWTCLP